MINLTSSVRIILVIFILAGCKKELVKDPVFKYKADFLVGTNTSMHFINKTTGFIGTNYGKVFRTTDAGNTFNMVGNLYTGTSVRDIHFTDENHGFVISDGLKKFDGTYWLDVDLSSPVSSILFMDENHGLVYGSSDIMYFTKDGGANWTQTRVGATLTITSYSVSFNDDFGVLTTGNEIFYSKDYGETWKKVEKSRIKNNNDIVGESSTNLDFTTNLVIDKSNIILINEDGIGFTDSKFNSISQNYYYDYSYNYYLYQTSSPLINYQENYIFLAGTDGYDYYSKDGGATWRKITLEGGSSVQYQTVDDEIYSLTTNGLRIGKF